MAEEFEIQTVADVKTIDYMRVNNDIIEQATNQSDMISEALIDIKDTIKENQNQVDLSEVTDLIENIDTTVVEVQTQDILNTINEQQNEINEIKESINEMNDKLNQIISKL